MKNIIARIGVPMMASMLLFGCAGQSKEKTVNTDVAAVQKQQNDSSLLSTIELDGMKVTWIRDNANDRIMPLSLFPDATKAQIDSLSLQDGVPASVSTFLVEKDGKQILFDTGMGAPDSKLPEGLKALNINPSEIDYLYITHFHGAALQLKYPEICATYDMDKSGAVKSRKHYVQYARENGLVIAGMHLPVPAFMK